MKIDSLLIASALVASLAPSLASATTLDVSLNTAPFTFNSYDLSGAPIAGGVVAAGADHVTNNNVPFWTATYTFNLASANQTLSITNLVADDRTVVELNGTIVGAAGIGAINPSSNGTFVFTPTGHQVVQAFTANGPQTINVSDPFVVGLNIIELIVNNTNTGINGGLSGGPSSLSFSGSISPVPEPGTGVLLMIGLLGLVARRRPA